MTSSQNNEIKIKCRGYNSAEQGKALLKHLLLKWNVPTGKK